MGISVFKKNWLKFYFPLFCCIISNIKLEAEPVRIGGFITNARSNQVYLFSNQERKDSFLLNHQGGFSIDFELRKYEKQFYLTWNTVEGYRKDISLILDQGDIVDIYMSINTEKVLFTQGDTVRKQKIGQLIENIYINNHEKLSLGKENYDSINKLVFKQIDTLFSEDNIITVDVLNSIKRTLFIDDFARQQMNRIWQMIESIPADAKSSLPSYKALARKAWPGKFFIDFEYLDTLGVLQQTRELGGNKIFLMQFGASWCAPCRKKNQLLKEKMLAEKLLIDIDVFSMSFDEDNQDWKHSLILDQLPWKQGIVKNETHKRVLIDLFHVDLIPLSVLVDKNRHVVKFNPSVEEIILFSKEQK